MRTGSWNRRIISLIFKYIMSAFLLSRFALFFPLEAASFHAILIGDTNDPQLHRLIALDIINIRDHLDLLVPYLELEAYKQTLLIGNNVDASIRKKLMNLDIQPDDIVFFYFSGHGYESNASDAEQWPRLLFTNDLTSMKQTAVVKILQKYRPRLIICLADCCNDINDYFFYDVLSASLANKNRETALIIKPESVKQLFLLLRGVIMISSSSPGYRALGTNKEGSYFTRLYIKEVNHAVRTGNSAGWEIILKKVTTLLWEQQRPQFDLIVEECAH